MNSQIKILFNAILLLAFTTTGAQPQFEPLPLEGQTFTHDPSTIVKDGGRFYSFGTGPGIRTKSSLDLIHWENGDSVFRTSSSRATRRGPGLGSIPRAPGVIRVR